VLVDLIDALIAFLESLKGMDALNQGLTIIGLFTALGAIIGLPIRFANRKVADSVSEYTKLEALLKTARSEAEKHRRNCETLTQKSPGAFLEKYESEMRDGNDERAMTLSQAFIDDQTEALQTAYRMRMIEAIRQAPEDGAPAYYTARLWAQAALALRPQDQKLRMLIDELGEAAGLAKATGARVKLKSDADRDARIARGERLPTDLNALTDAFFSARHNGHYQLMLFLAEHGLMITRRTPFGVGSREHLRFRRHRAEANLYNGSYEDGLAEIIEILPALDSGFGETDPTTLYARFLKASCLQHLGRAQDALDEAEALIPLRTKAFRSDAHPEVLTTRYLKASCLQDLGRAQDAMDEAEALIPLRTKAHGSDAHPEVLTTRFLKASCLQHLGRAQDALDGAEALITLRTKAYGSDAHPKVLATRYLKASCLQHLGRAQDALGGAEALIPLQTKAYGSDAHPYVLETRYLKAQCLKDLGRAQDALDEAEALIPLLNKAYGSDAHPQVLSTRILFSKCLSGMGNRLAAARALDGVREGLEAAGLSAEHRFFKRLAEAEDLISESERIDG
jgi:hypothetical protein